MSDNRISLVITPEQRQSAMAGLVQTKGALPELPLLAPGERRELYPFGAKNEVFSRSIVRALQAHPQIVPATLNVTAAQADLDAIDALRPLLEAVALLHAQLEDTVTLLGHDVVDFAYDGYQLLKLSGDASNGLDELRRDVGKQFDRRHRPAANPNPAS